MSAPQFSASTKRRFLFVLTGVALALLLAIAASFLLALRSRSEAARYLRGVTALPVGTSYKDALAKLHDAGIRNGLSSDCPRYECSLVFEVDDRSLYLLHLAPPSGLSGGLRFRDEKLVDKEIAMGYGPAYGAHCAIVRETASKVFITSSSVDSLGHPVPIHVEIAASDFNDFRKQVYAFDVTCIGSIRGCRTDEYLPTAKFLRQQTPE